MQPQLLQLLEIPEFGRDQPGKGIVRQAQFLNLLEVPELGRD